MSFEIGDYVQVLGRGEEWSGIVTAFDGTFYAVSCPADNMRNQCAWFAGSLILAEHDDKLAIKVLGEDYFA